MNLPTNQNNPTRGEDYNTLWERLKKVDADGELYLNLEVPSGREQDALLLGLRKQSLKDKGFRFACIEKEKSFTIGFNSLGDILQLYIKWRPHVTDAFAGIKSGAGKKKRKS